MSTDPLTRAAATPYEQDFFAWAQETARLLREGRFEQVDSEHLAEEIEAMANRDRRELLSRLTVLVHHLLKWKWQPDKRTGSWKLTVGSQRREIQVLFEESPSLRRIVFPVLPRRVYRGAVQDAVNETGLPEDAFPRECPFSVAQILDEGFFPEP